MTELKAKKENVSMIRGLLDLLPFELEKTTELERQLLSAFSFGMIYAAGKLKSLEPAQVQAQSISILCDVYKYSPSQAGGFSEMLVEASANRASNPVINVVIHRGITGHYHWERKEYDKLRSSVIEILNEVK